MYSFLRLASAATIKREGSFREQMRGAEGRVLQCNIPNKTDHEKSLIQRQIDVTDKQIDQLVYELYGLTDDEIRTVEEATK